MTLHAVDDWQLIQAYAKDRSETAFAELVRLHLDWVHSVALRHVSDPHLAEDVVQSVFVLLARKAPELRPGTILSGWLFRTTCHVASHAQRAEQRRRSREATACTMINDSNTPDNDEILWQQLAPHLDLAVGALSEADRSAILLRFYEKAPMRKVGERLGVTEDAAKKRVSRAVERMRGFLVKRGVKLGGVMLAAVLAEKTVHAAPATMAATVAKVAVAATSASTSVMLPPLARKTLDAWHWAKVKLAAVLAASSLALVLFVANVGGLFRSNPASQSADDGSTSANAGTPAQNQNRKAISSPAVNKESQAPGKTGAVTGRVLDDRGQPIAGAKVWAGLSFSPIAEDMTDPSGYFALDRIGGPPFVTVTADGYAADQQEVDPTNLPGPLIFRLSPVPPLKARLVDESGRGVPGARLFLFQWWGQPGTLAQYLPQPTDADGALEWLSPPKGQLELQFATMGYRASRTNKFAADGEEHLIVLHPSAIVTGRVTDANTGAPVESFKITIGHGQPWVPSDPVPMWDLHSQDGSNGLYKALIEEEQVPWLRIEADGYETIETEIELTNGVEGARDFHLKRTSADNLIRGVVLMPDGTPAAGVEVALCTAQAGVKLEGTAFAPGAFGNINPSQQGDYRRKTDEQGTFSFDPKPGAHTVAAVGPAGLGQMRCFDFSAPLEIRLQAWARVEGNVRTRDSQWGERKVKWQQTGRLTSWMTLYYDPNGLSTMSDANGKFTLEHVPPGYGRLEIDDAASGAPILSRPIEATAGEIVQAQVGGVGQAVTGRLIAPAGLEIRSWPDQVTIASLYLQSDYYPLPKDLTGNAAERWKLEFEDTTAGRAWFRDQCSYNFKVASDGSFAMPEVLQGKYQLIINVSQGNLGSGPDSKPRDPGSPRIAFGGMKVVVPDATGDSGPALDLGEIILTADQ